MKTHTAKVPCSHKYSCQLNLTVVISRLCEKQEKTTRFALNFFGLLTLGIENV